MSKDHKDETRPDLRKLIDALNQLTDDERALIFLHYCKHCGSLDPGCQCWNDE